MPGAERAQESHASHRAARNSAQKVCKMFASLTAQLETQLTRFVKC